MGRTGHHRCWHAGLASQARLPEAWPGLYSLFILQAALTPSQADGPSERQQGHSQPEGRRSFPCSFALRLCPPATAWSCVRDSAGCLASGSLRSEGVCFMSQKHRTTSLRSR